VNKKYILFIFSLLFLCNCIYSQQRLNREFIERIIKGDVINNELVIFKFFELEDELNIYEIVSVYGSNYIVTIIDFDNYSIMVVSLWNDTFKYNIVSDYLILEKEAEAYFECWGTVIVDHKTYYDAGIAVVLHGYFNRHSDKSYSDNISRAYIVNKETGKIENLEYTTIRIHGITPGMK
jgi:hypothetical protein